MKFHTRHFRDDHAVVKRDVHVDGSTKLWVLDRYGNVLCEATVCLRDYHRTPAPGHVFVKDWGDNEGVLYALQDAGVVGRTLSTVQTGTPQDRRLAHECALLDAP